MSFSRRSLEKRFGSDSDESSERRSSSHVSSTSDEDSESSHLEEESVVSDEDKEALEEKEEDEDEVTSSEEATLSSHNEDHSESTKSSDENELQDGDDSSSSHIDALLSTTRKGQVENENDDEDDVSRESESGYSTGTNSTDDLPPSSKNLLKRENDDDNEKVFIEEAKMEQKRMEEAAFAAAEKKLQEKSEAKKRAQEIERKAAEEAAFAAAEKRLQEKAKSKSKNLVDEKKEKLKDSHENLAAKADSVPIEKKRNEKADQKPENKVSEDTSTKKSSKRKVTEDVDHEEGAVEDSASFQIPGEDDPEISFEKRSATSSESDLFGLPPWKYGSQSYDDTNVGEKKPRGIFGFRRRAKSEDDIVDTGNSGDENDPPSKKRRFFGRRRKKDDSPDKTSGFALFSDADEEEDHLYESDDGDTSDLLLKAPNNGQDSMDVAAATITPSNKEKKMKKNRGLFGIFGRKNETQIFSKAEEQDNLEKFSDDDVPTLASVQSGALNSVKSTQKSPDVDSQNIDQKVMSDSDANRRQRRLSNGAIDADTGCHSSTIVGESEDKEFIHKIRSMEEEITELKKAARLKELETEIATLRRVQYDEETTKQKEISELKKAKKLKEMETQIVALKKLISDEEERLNEVQRAMIAQQDKAREAAVAELAAIEVESRQRATLRQQDESKLMEDRQLRNTDSVMDPNDASAPSLSTKDVSGDVINQSDESRQTNEIRSDAPEDDARCDEKREDEQPAQRSWFGFMHQKEHDDESNHEFVGESTNTVLVPPVLDTDTDFATSVSVQKDPESQSEIFNEQALSPAPTVDKTSDSATQRSKESRGFLSFFSKKQKAAPEAALENDLEQQVLPSRSPDPPIHGRLQARSENELCSRRNLWLLLLFVLFLLIAILSGIGFAYIGVALGLWGDKNTSNNSEIPASPTTSPVTIGPTEPLSPTSPPVNPAAVCERENEALLRFEILFDAKPGEVGFSLSEEDSVGGSIWLFEADTFRSFTQFQRTNVFSVCLSAATTYDFEITDALIDGLVSPLSSDSFVYGSWTLTYNNNVIVEYNGDCNALEYSESVVLTECGAYCSCSFTFSGASTRGGCDTLCN